MRKEILLFAVFFLMLPVLVYGQNTVNKESFSVGRYKFELMEKDSNCVLSYTRNGRTEELTLDTPMTCRMVRDNKNNIRTFKYKDIGATVFMILGEVSQEPKSGKECGKKMQVILVKKNKVVLGKSQSGAACVLYGPDEKVFWILSH
jgi:hypothetical protein